MKILEKIQEIIKITETDKQFWQDVYKKDKTEWLNKEPSKFAKDILKKYKPVNNILEIGCAAGIDTFLLSNLANKQIIGIDIINDVIQLANSNLEKQKDAIKKKVKFEIGDAENLKYKDGSFDLVYSLSVLHSTDLSKSLKEVNRVLTQDGEAAIHIITHETEGIGEVEFLQTCEKYFEVEEHKSGTKGEHKFSIVFLKKEEK